MINALPSPERAITTANLKKDVKYGLGEFGKQTSYHIEMLTDDLR